MITTQIGNFNKNVNILSDRRSPYPPSNIQNTIILKSKK